MQISSFTPYARLQKNNVTNQNEVNNIQPCISSVETAGTVGISPLEIIGRSQVNFCAKKNDFQLNEADKHFVDGISKVFRLDKSEKQEAEQILKNFMQEFNFKSLSDMKSDDPFEFANELACLSERICNRFSLSDTDMTTMADLLCCQSNIGDITKISRPNGLNLVETHKYSKDYIPIVSILENNGIEYDKSTAIMSIFHDTAELLQLPSIVDLFNEDNLPDTIKLLDLVGNYPGMEFFDNDKRINVTIDMARLAKIPEKERYKNFNLHKCRDMFDDGIKTLVIAQNLSENFDIPITKDLLELLNTRDSKSQVSENNKSLMEIAYYISEKFNLPANSVKRIAKIIEDTEKTPFDEDKMKQLIKCFQNPNQDIGD